MDRKLSCLAGALSVFSWACVAAPPSEDGTADFDRPDGAVSGVVLDAGPTRPEAGPAYRGPQCETGTSDGAAGLAAAWDDAPPSTSDAGQLQPGASRLPEDPQDELENRQQAETDGGSDSRTRLRSPARGEVVITELMIDPSAVSDSEGEWIELQNVTDDDLEIGGCLVDDGGSSPRELPELSITPMQYLVIARAAQAGLSPDATLSLSLTNTMDRVALVCNGEIVDEVVYGPGFPLVAGASLSLDPEHTSEQGNNLAEAWCASSAAFGSDRGTPGAPNPPCMKASDVDAGVP